MGNIVSASGVVLSEIYHSAPLGVSNVAVGSGISYAGSRYVLHSLGVPSEVADAIAKTLAAIGVAYVE